MTAFRRVVRLHPCKENFGRLGYFGEVKIRANMTTGKNKTSIELGMKVSVRRSGQNRIGVVTGLQGEYVIVRWTNSDLGETTEHEAHLDEVTPLAGWL